MPFTNDMTVMQVRPNYSIVYQFKPALKIEPRHAETRVDFVNHMKEVTKTWKDGDYFLRSCKGTFCYMTINGRRIKLQKKSKITGKEYLCWDYFQTTTVKKVKKKVAKKR